MRAGELNRRISISEKVITRLPSGAETSAWSIKMHTWAKVLQKKQAESIDNQNFVLTDELLFKIRYRNDLDTEMRINYDGKVYEIITITELGFKIGTAILTQKVD